MTYGYGKPLHDDDPAYHAEARLVYVASTNRIWQSVWNLTGYDPAPGMWAIIDPATLDITGYSTGDTTETDYITGLSFYDPVNDKVWSLTSSRLIKHDSDGTMLLDVACTIAAPYLEHTTGDVWGFNSSSRNLIKVNLSTGDLTDARYDYTDGTNILLLSDMVSDNDGNLWLLFYVQTSGFSFVRSEIVHYDVGADTSTSVWSTTTFADRASKLLYDSTADAVLAWQAGVGTYGQVFPIDVATETPGTAVALAADTNDAPQRWRYDSVRNRIWSMCATGGTGESEGDPHDVVVSLNPSTLAIDQTFPVLFEPTNTDNSNVPPNYWQAYSETLSTVLHEVDGGMVCWSASYYLYRDSDAYEIQTVFIGSWMPDATTAIRARLYPINTPQVRGT